MLGCLPCSVQEQHPESEMGSVMGSSPCHGASDPAEVEMSRPLSPLLTLQGALEAARVPLTGAQRGPGLEANYGSGN